MEPTNTNNSLSKILILGVGNAGNKILESIQDNNQMVDYKAIFTDKKLFMNSSIHKKLIIGKKTLNASGTNGDPQMGKHAAMESFKEIIELTIGYEMIFVVGALGGGTATGVMPTIARACKRNNTICVAITILPFAAESKKIQKIARNGLEEIQNEYNTTFILMNDKIVINSPEIKSVYEALQYANIEIERFLNGIVKLVSNNGLINVDINDLIMIFKDSKKAYYGYGRASSSENIQEAVIEALQSPLILDSIKGATTTIIYLFCSPKIKMSDMQDLINEFKHSDRLGENCDIMFGVTMDKENDEIDVQVIATGFNVSKRVKSFDDYWIINDEDTNEEEQGMIEEKSVFISYSSSDRNEVVRIIQGMQAVNPSLKIFFDIDSLHSGQNWESRIQWNLDNSDVLFLCWSKEASQSFFVNYEWHYFMEKKGIDKIIPIPLENADVCPPPPELKHKHFSDSLNYIIKKNK